MAFPEPIAVKGLRDRQRELKALEDGAHKRLRVVFNDAAEGVVTDASRRVPVGPTGKARKSVAARSTQTKARVKGGGNKAPYYPWLDFGGRVGPGGSVTRPFLKRGRYIYRSFHDNRNEVHDALSKGLRMLIAETGLEE